MTDGGVVFSAQALGASRHSPPKTGSGSVRTRLVGWLALLRALSSVNVWRAFSIAVTSVLGITLAPKAFLAHI
jgi:hypothetical protein